MSSTKNYQREYGAVSKEDRAGRILLYAVVFLAEYHILWCLLHSFIWKLPYQKFEQWFALILLIAGTIFLVRKAAGRDEPLRYLRKLARYFYSREQCILMGLFLWFVLDCAIHQTVFGGSYFKDDDWKMFQFGLAAMLFFAFVRLTGPGKARRIIEGMIHLTTAVYSSFCAFVLWNYLHANYITFPSGRQLSIAVEQSMSMKMGVNQNITAAQATVILALCIYMIITQRKWIKVVYLIPAAVLLMVIILSNSRASYLSSLCMIIAAVALFAYRKQLINRSATADHTTVKQKTGPSIAKRMPGNKKMLRIAAAVIILILCLIVIHWLRSAMFSALQYSVNVNSNETIDAHDAARTFSSGMSGRGQMWRAVIIMICSSPVNFFLGVMPSMVGKTLIEMRFYNNIQPHCHNLILQIAASLGVPAMVFYCVFLISLIRRSIRLAGNRDDRRYEHAWAIPIVLMGILVIDTVESFLFGPSCVNMPVFYLFAGWLTALDQSYERSKKRHESMLIK